MPNRLCAGIGGASSTHPCYLCEATAAEMQAGQKGIPRNIARNERNATAFKGKKAKKQHAKIYKNATRMPMLPKIPLNEYGIPHLHIILGWLVS